MTQPKKQHHKINEQRLDELIEEATVDCHDDEEQRYGLVVSVIDNVSCPFQAKVVGENVEVTQLKDERDIIAVCKKNNKTYHIDLASLEFTKDLPEGYEWIEAFFKWRRYDW